jgi:hypothetical protein
VEQELLRVLINCLSADAALENLSTRREHARIMAKFEDALTAYIESQMSMSQIAAAVGVPEHTLRRWHEPQPVSSAATAEPGAF